MSKSDDTIHLPSRHVSYSSSYTKAEDLHDLPTNDTKHTPDLQHADLEKQSRSQAPSGDAKPKDPNLVCYMFSKSSR